MLEHIFWPLRCIMGFLIKISAAVTMEIYVSCSYVGNVSVRKPGALHAEN